ncbi:hypothetical protein F4V43_10225 [Paenibacillus spiritus]|uniref:Uncharacterized protein n=1 Tax=Paenibacillus spiritus TaxID=2496557 RepID=A0A5J5G9Q3_9BACL|nr:MULTISPECIES: hypothetical protein [Paenibacillus]KAA9004691.1 hypothetical protein F4V43_10225 [Paenibacillus spiritus]
MSTQKEPEDDGLVTERDIDEEFGLFREGSYEDSLSDEDQRDAIRHGLPDEQKLRREDRL